MFSAQLFEFLSLNGKICTSSLAPSTKRQIRGLQVIPELWILSIELASSHPSGAWNVDVAITFMEYLSMWPLHLWNICGCGHYTYGIFVASCLKHAALCNFITHFDCIFRAY